MAPPTWREVLNAAAAAPCRAGSTAAMDCEVMVVTGSPEKNPAGRRASTSGHSADEVLAHPTARSVAARMAWPAPRTAGRPTRSARTTTTRPSTPKSQTCARPSANSSATPSEQARCAPTWTGATFRSSSPVPSPPATPSASPPERINRSTTSRSFSTRCALSPRIAGNRRRRPAGAGGQRGAEPACWAASPASSRCRGCRGCRESRIRHVRPADGPAGENTPGIYAQDCWLHRRAGRRDGNPGAKTNQSRPERRWPGAAKDQTGAAARHTHRCLVTHSAVWGGRDRHFMALV
jgi:hypothetical protein